MGIEEKKTEKHTEEKEPQKAQQMFEEVELDDLDVENWGELPPSDNEKEAENNLLHIRGISAFVMSGLADSSDSEKGGKEEEESKELEGSIRRAREKQGEPGRPIQKAP